MLSEDTLYGAAFMIQALIFDFDGLLVDTETPAFESWRVIYAEHGHDLSLDLYQHALGTSHGFDPLAHLEGLIGRPLDRAAAHEEIGTHTVIARAVKDEAVLDQDVGRCLRQGRCSESQFRQARIDAGHAHLR